MQALEVLFDKQLELERSAGRLRGMDANSVAVDPLMRYDRRNSDTDRFLIEHSRYSVSVRHGLNGVRKHSVRCEASRRVNSPREAKLRYFFLR
jgi:hypothetical protein